MKPCPLCRIATSEKDLAEASWIPTDVEIRVAAEHPGWRRADGACPACVQQALLTILLEKGDAALHHTLQAVWPLDVEAAFGALPTPLRLHADPRFQGQGATIALVDAGFYPHPDLVAPRNRIRAVVDASREPVEVWHFDASQEPRWPGWEAARPGQWHGLMTSTAAAGNGWLSHGLYRGLASEAAVVLVQVAGPNGRIGNEAIARALDWLSAHGPKLGVRVVNLSLGGDAVTPLVGNAVDNAVASLVAQGITVVAAAGNEGRRHLVPPATAPTALTVGGLDDKNTFDHREVALWRSNYGETEGNVPKPELVAPSLWVVAPVLPGTEVAAEARALFIRRAAGDPSVEERIRQTKLVTPYYQHVEGTSFAAPLVASVVACMLEANPDLTPRRVRELLLNAAQPVPGAPPERQGAGALDAGRAVTLALADRHSSNADCSQSPLVEDGAVRFLLHDHRAREVRVLGSWNGWQPPGLEASPLELGVWQARLGALGPGSYAYKFLVDQRLWLVDPANPARVADSYGGFNSLVDPSKVR